MCFKYIQSTILYCPLKKKDDITIQIIQVSHIDFWNEVGVKQSGKSLRFCFPLRTIAARWVGSPYMTE